MFCEGRRLFIDCPKSKVISIKSANVECCSEPCDRVKDNAHKCNLLEQTLTSMHESNNQSLRSAIAACDGKSSCVLSLSFDKDEATSNIGNHDPCVGKNKRANIAHTCIGINVFEFAYSLQRIK